MTIKKILIEDYKPVIVNRSDDEDESNDTENLVNTPFGVYRMNDSMNPVKQFNLKMVNTNFPITLRTKIILDNLEGIEVFFPITRYKCIIGIGKIFEEKDIIENIKKALVGTSNVLLYTSNKLNQNVNDLIEKLNKTNKYWVMYAFPNGSLEYSTDTDNYKLYKEAQALSKGQIIISEKLQEKLKNVKNK